MLIVQQLLKFVEKVAPIGVYTSGKGSSAAGLTASIIKEPGTGDYYLEGGSMVLADSGIVCIDEFDKMRAQDRLFLHFLILELRSMKQWNNKQSVSRKQELLQSSTVEHLYWQQQTQYLEDMMT
jgi:hypothetical protein